MAGSVTLDLFYILSGPFAILHLPVQISQSLQHLQLERVLNNRLAPSHFTPKAAKVGVSGFVHHYLTKDWPSGHTECRASGFQSRVLPTVTILSLPGLSPYCPVNQRHTLLNSSLFPVLILSPLIVTFLRAGATVLCKRSPSIFADEGRNHWGDASWSFPRWKPALRKCRVPRVLEGDRKADECPVAMLVSQEELQPPQQGCGQSSPGGGPARAARGQRQSRGLTRDLCKSCVESPPAAT